MAVLPGTAAKGGCMIIGDAAGHYIALNLNMELNQYYEFGYALGANILISNYSSAAANIVQAPDTDMSTWATMKYVITGIGTAGGNIKGYLDGAAVPSADWNVDMTNPNTVLGPITQIWIQLKKTIDFDDLAIREP